jgi:hypothetical protein
MDLGTNRERQNVPVEVSGWDTSEKFFVESTKIRWGRDEKKELSLRGAVHEGCVVFVRPLQPVEGTDSFPIACQVVKVVGKDGDGRRRVQVVQLRPRAFLRETARELNRSGIKVA